MGFLHGASVWVLPVMVAIVCHEVAHGWVAYLLGDNTAAERGRLTLNPLAHVDPVGSVLVPGALFLSGAPFLFGWAKPVPINIFRTRYPKRNLVWIALAGPATNIALAVTFALSLRLLGDMQGPIGAWVATNLINAVIINVVLAVFNMIPLPPLDGGKVVIGIAPPAIARPLLRLEKWGFLIVIGVVFVLPYVGARLGLELDVFAWLVLGPVNFLLEVIVVLVGLS